MDGRECQVKPCRYRPGLEFPWGANKGRWCLGSHEESTVCYPVLLSFPLPLSSPALGPGTEGCLWKVMEIRWNVVLLWRQGTAAITATSMERPLNICCSLRKGGVNTSCQLLPWCIVQTYISTSHFIFFLSFLFFMKTFLPRGIIQAFLLKM